MQLRRRAERAATVAPGGHPWVDRLIARAGTRRREATDLLHSTATATAAARSRGRSRPSPGRSTSAGATFGQMSVRIALQCSEADSRIILSEDNGAARLLSRSGEAIDNDANGLTEGNHFFQVVWQPEDVREDYPGATA